MTGHDRSATDDDRIDDVESGEEQTTTTASRTSAKSGNERIRYNPTREGDN